MAVYSGEMVNCGTVRSLLPLVRYGSMYGKGGGSAKLWQRSYEIPERWPLLLAPGSRLPCFAGVDVSVFSCPTQVGEGRLVVSAWGTVEKGVREKSDP